MVLAPFSGGQLKYGVEKGPDFLLKHGLEKDLVELGWDVTITEPLKGKNLADSNDADSEFPTVKKPTLVGETTHLINQTITDSLKDDKFILTLGGDHSIAMGSISAVLEKYDDLCLLWIDAHADINTVESTESGNLHGCPVSFLMGVNPPDKIPKSLSWIKGNLKPNRIAYIGLRDVDEGEKKILKENNIKAFSMYHIDRFGINKVIEMALQAINPTGKSPLMCSFDVDAIDPLYVPATGTPVRGGLTLREGLFLTERLAETGNLVALDVVECNPDLAQNETHVLDTISAGCAIARCALGETLL
ncbi:hypothetical protein TBLA_0B04280 [Henningerozyma blattae CBS 6284]|uniref:Arginase n=1 Tax=Henningerozyma blattae (strain ATCC 34711 / CBS 6284 / DSM 70876 / NBRC 10599 / NRRL Y-10934 / UCD 77-7) TaxID=1071380 RepID=I2GYR4_HENB6|nr:hypothetical protein TBLA_0B04280 [Tetrapisispora blattae CBS 6284]CCH59266.1 hypothetical protein TBLA_0B04280 [Tetrapisispora blattae CBS 6284]